MARINIIENVNLGIQSQAIGTIIVNWEKEDSKLFCVIHPTDDNPIFWTLSLDKQDMESFRSSFQALLTKYVKDKYNPQQFKALVEKLQSLGHRMFTRIIPDEFHSIIKNWQGGSIVNVSTNESYIPWELLCDGDDFLGLKFMFCRLPRLTSRTTVAQTETSSCIVHVKGNTIKASLSATDIFDKYSYSVNEPKPLTIDILHTVENLTFA